MLKIHNSKHFLINTPKRLALTDFQNYVKNLYALLNLPIEFMIKFSNAFLPKYYP